MDRLGYIKIHEPIKNNNIQLNDGNIAIIIKL